MQQKTVVHVIMMSAGYACFLALNSFSLWGFSLLPETILGREAAEWWSQSLSCANALSFLVLAIMAARLNSCRARFGQITTVLACSLFVVAVVCGGCFLLSAVPAILVIGGAAMGAATTCGFFCWVHALAAEGVESAQIKIILGSVLSAVPFLAFLTLDSSIIAAAFFLLLLLNMAILIGLRKASAGEPPAGRGGLSSDTNEVVSSRSGLDSTSSAVAMLKNGLSAFWRPLLCAALVGCMAPAVSLLGSAALGEMPFAWRALMVHSENVLAAALLGVVWIALRHKVNMVKTFTVLFPLLITLFLLFFVWPPVRAIIPYAGGVVFVVCSMTMFVESIAKAEETHSNLGVVYGLFAGVLYLSHYLGSLALAHIDGDALSGETAMMAVSAVLLYGCSLVMFFVARKPSAAPESALPVSENTQCEASPFSADPSERKTRALAAQVGLSERQTEVLALLARGYTLPAIASALYLSENTVRTHTKKIYAALDVHSKQELIERVSKEDG